MGYSKISFYTNLSIKCCLIGKRSANEITFYYSCRRYLTGAYIEEKLSTKEYSYNVWVPGRDTGVDLLVTNADNTKMCSLQIKYTRIYSHYCIYDHGK